MRDFQFYVTDDRSDVRSLLLVSVVGQCRARRIAERVLAEPHHHAVEVWDHERKLFTLRETESDPMDGDEHTMRRQAHSQRHTVIYENHGAEIDRYTVSADSERTAERRTTRLFFKGHREFDELELNLGLTFRIEADDAPGSWKRQASAR